MKLRIRSMATKVTQRVTIPDTSSLVDLKTLIASNPSFASSSNPNPNSIHLSLNRSAELVSQNPNASLKDLSLTTGDLLFFSLSSFPQNLEIRNPIPGFPIPGSDAGESIEPMKIHAQPRIINKSEKKPHLIPRSLIKLMDFDKIEDDGILGQLIKITHAALSDMGFILHNGSDFNFPQNLSSKASTLDLKYTIPSLMDPAHTLNAQLAILKFSLDGNYATIYGYFKSDFYRACFDLAKIATLLSSNLNLMNQNEQKEFLDIFRVLKDGISLPLMIDLCIKNNLPLPPCFMLLSTDIKYKILELITGADMARVGSTCTEIRNLSSDDNLWKQKLEKEFENHPADVFRVTSAREKYKRAYIEKRSKKRSLTNLSQLRRPARPGFGITRGNYDRFPLNYDGLFGMGYNSRFRALQGRGQDVPWMFGRPLRDYY